jgi:hypothetical protein
VRRADGGGHEDHKGHKITKKITCVFVIFVAFVTFVILVAAAVGPSQSLWVLSSETMICSCTPSRDSSKNRHARLGRWR